MSVKRQINIIGMFCISVADVITYGYQLPLTV